ncbi:MAG: hypothetical protein KDA32_14850, partial [Phycisphaerales bacterium]|nr:hypothetical protein [Phycisphaerales bacterium]
RKRPLNLDWSERKDMIERLPSRDGPAKRPYRPIVGGLLTIGDRTLLIQPCQISEVDLAILTDQFVYAGSQCAVRLRALDGEWITLNAEVAYCGYVRGHVHETGIRFAEKVDAQTLDRFAPAHAIKAVVVAPQHP